MPVLPGNQSYSPTVQQVLDQLKSNPDFFNVLGGAAGYSAYPGLTVANEVMCRILAENMPWKWNRKVAAPFLTVSLQQDYVSNITDIGWLEDAWRVDINNSTSNANRAPKPIFAMETVRDDLWTSTQSVPFNISYIPNYQASLGLWQADTAYSCGYGAAQLPVSPIQQFMDADGNILFIDSTQLGLNIESPGYTGTTIPLPSTAPYGVSGSTQPTAGPGATPGTLIQDGSVVWTVADSNGYTFRLNPTPALNGLCWFIVCQYQVRPPRLLTLKDTLAPIPNEMIYLFRQGMRAALYRENGNKDGMNQYSDWEETLMKAVRAGDRQQEDFRMYPERGAMGVDGGWSANWQGIGAAWPFGPGPYGG